MAAADLYMASQLFRGRRRYAEATGTPWAILSALHGVVTPERGLAPYDFPIQRRRLVQPVGWAIGCVQDCYSLAGRQLGDRLTVEIHAGRPYVELLERGRYHAGATLLRFTHPVRGLQIGQQLAFYRMPPDAGAGNA